MSVVMKANHIIVLGNDGKVAQGGTHESLLQAKAGISTQCN
jgi:ABC-type transport system involved in Fe-S cluster assembly fused permease/ATPase subunit